METYIVKNGMNINNTSLDGYVKGSAVSSIPHFYPFTPFTDLLDARKILSALPLQIGHVLLWMRWMGCLLEIEVVWAL